MPYHPPAMAAYEQTGPGGKRYWVVDFQWTDAATGKKRRIRRAAKDAKGRPVKSQTAADKCEDSIRSQLALGTFEREAPVDTDATTLSGYKETYLADARVRLKPQTINQIEKTFRNWLVPTLGPTPLAEIDTSAVAALTRELHGRDLSAKSINNALSVLRATLAHAVEHRALATLPAIKWQRVAPTAIDFFTFEEAAKLAEYAPPFVVVAMRTGMRIGELLELKWSDVSLPRKQVTVSRSVWWEKGGVKHVGAPKNNKARVIPLTSDAVAVLEALPRRTGYVFADEAGSPLTPSACKWPLWSAQDAAGVRRSGPHVLRHTFASHLVMRSVGLPAVQQLMGHATIQMTMRYAHLAPDHLRSAIAALEG